MIDSIGSFFNIYSAQGWIFGFAIAFTVLFAFFFFFDKLRKSQKNSKNKILQVNKKKLKQEALDKKIIEIPGDKKAVQAKSKFRKVKRPHRGQKKRRFINQVLYKKKLYYNI